MIVGHVGLGPVAYCLRMLGFVESYVIVLHGVEAWKRLSFMRMKAAQSAGAIVATTVFTAQEFARKNGLGVDRMRVVPLALGITEVQEITRDDAPDVCLRVLSVGRLCSMERYKGTDELLEAVARLQVQGADVHLTVVGDGDDLGRLRNKAEELGIGRRVTFTGTVSDQQLDQAYRSCDVFALPSRGEGFGIVFLEAMRHGKPCIGSPEGGIPEVIRDGEDGFLVEYGDVDQLTEVLLRCYRDRPLARKMGRKGFEKVRQRYLLPHMAERWLSLLEEEGWLVSSVPADAVGQAVRGLGRLRS